MPANAHRDVLVDEVPVELQVRRRCALLCQRRDPTRTEDGHVRARIQERVGFHLAALEPLPETNADTKHRTHLVLRCVRVQLGVVRRHRKRLPRD